MSRARRLACLAVLDRLPYGMIIVDEHARVVNMNVAARAKTANLDGLQVAGDVLGAADEEHNRALLAAITAATSPAASGLSGTGALRVRCHSGELPVLVLPARVPVDPLLVRRGLALVVFGAESETAHRGLLIAMYGLTAREADFASALVAGRDLADAARVLGTTMHTARTHLRHLMEKTTTSRQGELVTLLLRSTPPRFADSR